MAENTAIEWCDHTFNPWEGCQKVGPGCDHCYAETRNARYGGGVAGNWGPGAPRRRTSVANWRKPVRWQEDAAAFLAEHGRRQRVFCASLADVFDNAVDRAWRADLFELIRATPDLDWLLLTKRIGNVAAMAEAAGGLPGNVWLGATIVNQEEADRDIPKLLATRARVRFLSMEPLLGPVDLGQLQADLPANAWLTWLDGLDWIIVGGESGPGARPMHPDWARSLRDQCAAAGVPFLFKQWGEWKPGWLERVLPSAGAEQPRQGPSGTWHSAVQWPDGTIGSGDHRTNGGSGLSFTRIGKKAAGRLLDGVTHDGFPTPRAPS